MFEKFTTWAEAYQIMPIRIALGLIFLYQGIQILFGFGGESGLAKTTELMKTWNLTPAHVWAFSFGFVKLVGGLFIILGIFTRTSAFLLSVVIGITIYKLYWPSQYLSVDMQMEYTVLLFAACVAMFLGGNGQISVRIDKK